MSDQLLRDIRYPAIIDIPLASPIPPLRDESLFLQASARWRESSQGLGELFAAAPIKSQTPDPSLQKSWDAYWQTRAPYTPVSRRERAGQLYRSHFEANAKVAFARRVLSAEQLKLLLSIMDSPEACPQPNDQPVQCEQPTLVLSDGGTIKLRAAWVISQGGTAPLTQMLYLPCRPFPIQVFNQRSDMEAWLSGQSLVPQGLPDDDIRFQYTCEAQPLTAGITDLLLHPPHAGAAFFASVPDVESAAPTATVGFDEPALFGSLYPDIPLDLRRTALNRQRDALATLLGDTVDSEALKSFKHSYKALEAAEQDADTAASALLYRARTLDMVTLNRQFTALHKAHKAGLHAEARLQLALEQLSDDDASLLKALLDTPDDPGPDRVAASLTLSMSEHNGHQTTVTTQALNGPFVMTQANALLDADSPHSLLLYWPGSGGGLQRFANRRELEQQVFLIHGTNSSQMLQLKRINGDPLRFALNTLTADFEEQAGGIRQRYTQTAAQRADELEILRKRALAALQVPVHAARSLAYTHHLEQNRSGALAAGLPDWLGKLSEAERVRLKGLLEAYIPAMRRSHGLLTLALIPRDDFTRQRLQARLRQDFSVKGHFQVQLDLPDSVILQKQVTDGASPGTPQKLVAVPSDTRSKMSLEELAQLNIDNTPSMQLEPLSLRLAFMRVEIITADEDERRTLAAGITHAYLKTLLPELDLPKVYEQQIRNTFMGSTNEARFVREHRRECLLEPWRLMLKLQGECARLQRHIRDDDLRLLDIAIDADSVDAWNIEGKRVVILPAFLRAGGKDTPNEGPVTLSGVTFINDQVSGTTLLYLPDRPDGQFLRRYDSLEAARKALFNLCLRSEMVGYLAGRALHGNVSAHESRINQATRKHYDAMIGVGVRWPVTTSFAAHLLNAHMGRLIEAHRGTSRSNDALYMERYALSGPRAFNYLKMALGLLPFIGTAFALYDAWTSANQAVAAFLRGDIGDGLAEIESVLLSLIDAAMDLLPGEAAASVLSRTARALTRARQLQRLGRTAAALQATSMRQARRTVERFAGYEYDQPISLVGLQPASHGVYRNIYRHADGDFIVRQGRIYQVEPSKDSRNWRLSGGRLKTYKQPIALDETGQWDTWFGVHGTIFEGGGLGGGAVLGHLANGLDPLWPQAIRQRLPRWWADQAYRRHNQLTNAADDLALRLNEQVSRSTLPIQNYGDSIAADRPALMAAAESACISDIEMASRHYRTLDELLPLTRGNKRRELSDMQSHDALLLTDRFKHRVYYANHRGQSIMDRIDALSARMDGLPPDSLSQRLNLLEQIRVARVALLQKLDDIEGLMRDLNLWHERISVRSHKTGVTPEVTQLNGRLSEANLTYLKTGHLLETVKRFDSVSDVSWFYLQARAQSLRAKVDRALFTQYSLPEVSATKPQRNRILQECIEHYTQFRRDMKVWTTSYPQHFHLDAVAPLIEGIEKMEKRARKSIDLPSPPAPVGRGNKKVFTTEDGQLLIGVERWKSTTQKREYVLTGQGGSEEVWEQGSNGKFRLLNPPEQASAPVQTNLPALVEDARKRLEYQQTYKTQIESYAGQDMLPVDLEHMMVSEANELTGRALRIERLEAQNPIIQQLRDKAGELKTAGREMRTRQSLASKNPTDGMLHDLKSQEVVEIRKPSPIKNLGKRRDGRIDYMQEYEIWDLTPTPAQILWYAHFHYSSAAPVFRQFEKAHLKLPEHRFLTHADDAQLPYADIGKKSVVLPFFDNL
ncbi:hypothetical protein HU727_006875 [Pseudomonas sp. SWRI153]|uniref:Dermonecrotic toxin N-terminal domain-containing protein n=2 Tax=Pseudomonas khorasanensis TaxID=2745508 RepID=A0A923F2Y0_9PSED|nr:hypothetical protein [Pseudomonas khorasanensis]